MKILDTYFILATFLPPWRINVSMFSRLTVLSAINNKRIKWAHENNKQTE